MIRGGQVKRIEDILASFRLTKELPALIDNIKDNTLDIFRFAKSLGSQGTNAISMLEDILSTAWETYPLEFTTDQSGNVRAGLIEIQALIHDNINEPLRNLTNAFDALTHPAAQLPNKDGNFNMKIGVASYQRWSSVSMDLPCTRQMTKHYTVSGFSGSFSYPEFYSCPYGPKHLPWPNQHIPYIKLNLG